MYTKTPNKKATETDSKPRSPGLRYLNRMRTAVFSIPPSEAPADAALVGRNLHQ